MANFRYSHLFTTKSGATAIEAASSALNQAEIALAIAAGEEKILFKNSASNVVAVPTEAQVDAKISAVTAVIEDNEQIVSSSLNDLNERKMDASAYTPTDLSDYYTKEEVDSAITEAVDDIEASAVFSAEYVSTAKTIYFYNQSGGTVDSIDATDFIKDGMVDSVEIKNVTISGESVPCLVVTFNTDAGKEEIDIPLSNIFNPSNYYTKSQVDDIIAEEVSAMTSGDSELWDAVNDETARATSAETDLENAIDELDNEKQDALTAGSCITIGTVSSVDNTIYFDPSKGSETVNLTAGTF